MAIIAVAGGTGRVGRSVVEAIVATQKHKVIILSRQPNSELEGTLGAPILTVDYTDIPAVTETLEENNVDTVISAIFMMPGASGDEPKEIELIRAADASKTTKRMILSNWGHPHKADHAEKLPSVVYKNKALAEAEKAKDLETTSVLTGFFMDFWGIPGVKSYFNPMIAFVDIPNAAAAIPGDGNTPVIMTHTSDVGRFVAASLDLEKWDPELYTVGDTVSMNQLLQYAEDATGKKFSVTYDSIEMLKGGSLTELPGQLSAYPFFPKAAFQALICTFGVWFAEGDLNYKPERTLNGMFPEIKPLTVKEMVNQAWKKSS